MEGGAVESGFMVEEGGKEGGNQTIMSSRWRFEFGQFG
ncbi:hypothetical protein QG37_08043 [Candidozyma auris]|nr:hypothetical protein QG37_08043 [[Candida] auris]